jgi:hypothetical protein
MREPSASCRKFQNIREPQPLILTVTKAVNWPNVVHVDLESHPIVLTTG